MEEKYLKKTWYLKLLLIVFLAFNVNVFSQSCAVNAGILSETICEGELGELIGNDPIPRIGDVEWSQISGPTVLITTPNATSSTVQGMIGGNTYVFRYSATCDDGIVAYQDKTIEVVALTEANAGSDIRSCPDTSGSLIISGNTPLNPGETGSWEIESDNDAGLTIDFPNSATSTIKLDPNSCGTTTIAWVIKSADYAPGQFCESRSEIDIVNYGGVTPIDAGPDETLSNCYTATQSTTLAASYGGCGLNGQQGTWSFVSGPSNPNIADVNSNTSAITGLVEGTYTFRWTVAGDCASGSDEVTITVPAATQDVTGAGGSVQRINICDPAITEVKLEGVVPTFAGETVEWVQTSGNVVTVEQPNNSSTLVTGIAPGSTYRFRYTITNTITNCISSRDYVVRFRNSTNTIVANAGNDIEGVCGQTQFTIPMTYSGSGVNRYQIVEGPVDSPLGPFPNTLRSLSGNLELELLTAGTYVINFYKSQNGLSQVGCTDGFDSLNIIVSAEPVQPNAGTSVNLQCGITSATLSGNTTTDETSLWSQISGPTLAAITTPFENTSTVTGLAPGTYVFQYKIQGGGTGCDNKYDEVTINVSSNTLTAAAAGTPQNICYGASVELLSNAPGANEFGRWTVVSAPVGDVITFDDENSPTAIASGFNTPSAVYELQWTIDYSNPGPSGCATPSTDNITITTGPNQSPVATAGTDLCLASGTGSFALNGNTLQAGQSGVWTVNPLVGLSIDDVNNPNSPVTINTEGNYELTWTVTDTSGAGCAPVSDSVSVVISAPITANAGADMQVCDTEVTMSANSTLGAEGTWKFISGTGDFLISDVNDPNATITFSYSDTYVFEWELKNGNCSSDTNQVTIEVGIPVTQATAGADQEICNATSVVLTGNAFKENFEIGSWSVLPGAPNTIVFSDATNPNVTVNGLVTGTYTFRWSISGVGNALCPDTFEDVVVEVVAPTTTDPSLLNLDFCNVTSVALNGEENSTGTWACTSGDCGSVTITYANAPTNNSNTATASGLSSGTYEFTYIPDSVNFGSGATCTQTQQVVTVNISGLPSAEPNAGADQLLCIADLAGNSTTLSGSTPPVDVAASDASWSIVTQPTGGVANIAAGQTNTPNATLENLTVPGLYVLEWNFSNGDCVKLADVVRIEVFAAPSTANAGTDDLLACELTYQTNATPVTTGIGTWTITSQPVGASTTIDNPNNPITTLSDVELGEYELTWTVTNGSFTNPSLCAPSEDTVIVRFNEAVPSDA